MEPLSLSINVQLQCGEERNSYSLQKSLDISGVGLSSVEDGQSAVNKVEAFLLPIRNDLFLAIVNMVVNLIAGYFATLMGPGKRSKRTVRTETILGRIQLPLFGVSFTKHGLRKTLYSAGMQKLITYGVTVQSLRNLTSDLNRQLQRTKEESLKSRTIGDVVKGIGMGVFSTLKTNATNTLEGIVSWVTVKNKRYPVVINTVAEAQGWGYHPITDPKLVDAHEKRVKDAVDKINKDTKCTLIERKKKKFGDNFDPKKAEMSVNRRIISLADMANHIESYDDKVVYIMIDGILSHLQKEKRQQPKKKRWTENNVAYVEVDGFREVFVAKEMDDLFAFILAFLYQNDLMDRRLVFFADGDEEIWKGVATVFSYTSYEMWLDYFHLVHKMYELSSSAFIMNKHKKEQIRSLLRAYLWNGRVDSALSYLETFKQKNHEKEVNLDKLESLITYIENKAPYIPCYAVRAELALPNSSNSVEQTNNQLVAIRQKNNGMSWSVEGSLSVACITMLKRNDKLDEYIDTGKLDFTFKKTDNVKVHGKRIKKLKELRRKEQEKERKTA